MLLAVNESYTTETYWNANLYSCSYILISRKAHVLYNT